MKRHASSGDDTCYDRDAEEPCRQTPDEDGHRRCEDFHDLDRDELLLAAAQHFACTGERVGYAVAEVVDVCPGPITRHSKECERGETGWTNSDEHGGPGVGTGESELDHAADVGCVHEDTYYESEALGCETSDNHWDGLIWWLVLTSGGRDGAA